jgi:hypothetical protein
MRRIETSYIAPLALVVVALAGFLWMVETTSTSKLLQQETPSIPQPTPAKDNAVQSAPISPPTQGATQNSPPECPLTDDMSQARQSAATLLQEIFKKEGRILTVKTAGAKCDVLELSSGLLVQGNHTFDAAMRETLDCQDCMALYKKVKFKKLRFVGPNTNEEFPIR